MRKRISIEQKNLPLLILILSAVWIVIVAAGLYVHHGEPVEIADFTARSGEREIELSWHNTGGDDGFVELTIESSEGRSVVQLDAGTTSYVFSDGEHGRRYDFTVMATDSEGAAGQAQTACALFLDWDLLPDLPVLTVETVNGQFPSCTYVSAEGNNWGYTITDNEYLSAQFTMVNQGSTQVNTAAEIRLRGNTSAYLEKKPYKLKLERSADLLGHEDALYNNKEWILLPFDTNLATVTGTKVAQLCGLEWQPACIPVNFCMNGDWMGTYLLIESVARGAARVNISETGFIIENNAYWWNADGFFKTPYQIAQMGYTFKYPGHDSVSDQMEALIQNYMTAYELALIEGAGDYTDYISLDSFASWLLVQDIMGIWDSGGTNMFLYKYDLNVGDLYSSKLKLGPAWDFSSSFMTEDAWARIHNDSILHFDALLQKEEFREVYLEKWRSLSGTLVGDMESYLDDFYAAYSDALQQSLELDASRWSTGVSQLDDAVSTANRWFSGRTAWLNEAMLSLEEG